MRRIVKFQFALLTLMLLAALAGGCKTAFTQGYRVSRAELADEAAMELRARAHAHYGAAVIHEMNGELDAALTEYYKAALDDPADESLVLDVTRRLLLAKQSDRALEILRAAAAQPDASGAIFARLGVTYSQLGRPADAVAANAKAVEKSPRLLSGYQNLFQSQLAAQHNDEALKILDQAARRTDTDAEFLIGLSELYGNYAIQFPSKRDAVEKKMIALLERAEKSEPTSLPLLLRLADGFYLAGNTDKAAELYKRSLDRVEDLPPLRDTVRARLAEIYLRGENLKGAREQMESIIRDDPSNARAYFLLGNIAYEEKRWSDAADNFEKAILFGPGLEQAYYNLAAARIAEGKGSDALPALQQARERFPQSFLLEYLFGVAFSQAKAYPESVQHFTSAEVIAQAGDTNKLTEEFYFQFGAACERKGDIAQAETCFKKAIQMSPDFAPALNYLGYMWADRGEHLEEARSLIERALKVEPDSAAYLDSMGWVLFRLGQFQPALDYILKAVKLNEEPDAELYDHLGDVYSALNQHEKAREAWQKSVVTAPNEKVQRKLEPKP